MTRFYAILFAATALGGCGDDNTPQYEYDRLSFENVDAQYLAGPTPAGENLYASYAGGQYTGYTDAATGLTMAVNEFGGDFDFWNGGIAISQWNCMADEGTITAQGYDNQCSVYFKAANGYGGHDGSPTFAAVFYASFGAAPAIYFEDGQTERVFDHLWVTNSTITALTMATGDYYSKILNYNDKDWLLLTIEGYDKAGAKKGEAKFYLADFRTSGAVGIVKRWEKVDLSGLGRVNRLEFVITGSDIGEYGLNTPAYFCFDDVAVRR